MLQLLLVAERLAVIVCFQMQGHSLQRAVAITARSVLIRLMTAQNGPAKIADALNGLREDDSTKLEVIVL